MEIVGHRGACAHAPENTLKSFAAAIRLGCQRAELDVQLTADRNPVVMHDETVERTTNGRGRVESLSRMDLKLLDAGGGERVPTLAEVMHFCRGHIDLQIELKAAGSPPPVADLIECLWGPDNIVITSFKLPLLDEIASFLPQISRGMLCKDAALDMITIAQERGHSWICPRSDIVSESLIRQAHRSALHVYAYHVNERDTASRLISWGIDAVGTDDPQMISELLSSQAQT
jgi:glycerophosphoryl diester phosphodiesterase